jgi:hypothetical protein
MNISWASSFLQNNTETLKSPSQKIFKWAITGVRNNTETWNNLTNPTLYHQGKAYAHLYAVSTTPFVSIYTCRICWVFTVHTAVDHKVSNKTSVSLTQFQLQLREEIKSQQQHYTFVRVCSTFDYTVVSIYTTFEQYFNVSWKTRSFHVIDNLQGIQINVFLRGKK